MTRARDDRAARARLQALAQTARSGDEEAVNAAVDTVGGAGDDKAAEETAGD
jgi:hypothetical protein